MTMKMMTIMKVKNLKKVKRAVKIMTSKKIKMIAITAMKIRQKKI